jgi:transposase
MPSVPSAEVMRMDVHAQVREFERRYKAEKNVRAKTRLQILLLRRQKYTQQEIATIARVTQGTVSNVCRRFRKEGWQSVHDKPREGRPSRLTREQKAWLKRRMQEEVVDGDIRRGWQTKDVAALLKAEFGISFTRQHLRRQLHGIGMSWKVPRPPHKNRDEKAVRAFKKSSPGRYCLWQMSTNSSA